jgi:hypothetical protein
MRRSRSDAIHADSLPAITVVLLVPYALKLRRCFQNWIDEKPLVSTPGN